MSSIFLVSSTIFGYLTYQDYSFQDLMKSYFQLSEVETGIPFYPDSLFIWIFTFSNVKKYEELSKSRVCFHSCLYDYFHGQGLLTVYVCCHGCCLFR